MGDVTCDCSPDVVGVHKARTRVHDHGYTRWHVSYHHRQSQDSDQRVANCGYFCYVEGEWLWTGVEPL